MNVAHHGWATKKNFQSMLSKIALKRIYFTFLSYRITTELHLTLEDFRKTVLIKELCKKSLENINYVKCHKLREKDHLCFNKKSTNQTFTFISSKVV